MPNRKPAYGRSDDHGLHSLLPLAAFRLLDKNVLKRSQSLGQPMGKFITAILACDVSDFKRYLSHTLRPMVFNLFCIATHYSNPL